MLLYRLASLASLVDVMEIFRASPSVIVNDLGHYIHIHELYSKKLYWDSPRLSREKLDRYAKAISDTAGGMSPGWTVLRK